MGLFGGNDEEDYTGQKWEYRVETYQNMSDASKLRKWLDEQGKVGWELVSVIPHQIVPQSGLEGYDTRSCALFLKRPIMSLEE